MDAIYYCPPDLLLLLIDTIDALHRSKLGVIHFFRGAGVRGSLIDDLEAQVACQCDSDGKVLCTI
jgi:hypothetical protein